MNFNKEAKLLIISAINFTDGGPLTVLHNILLNLIKYNNNKYEILVLVNSKKIVSDYGVNCIEFKHSKKSWFLRLYYEYIYFFFLSLKLKPHIWLSLHDVTPFVKARKQLVYCHNASPFYKVNISDLFFAPKFFLFCKLYIHLYKFNVNSNSFIIVQQEWLRNKFSKFYNEDNIVVSHPVLSSNVPTNISQKFINHEKLILFYPAFPRSFKNFEVVCEAISLLSEKDHDNIELRLTIDGNENRYSRYIYSKYKTIASINFIGLKKKDQIIDEFNDASIVVFPSKLETWGLPISEAKDLNKPLLISDLHYARETVGNYDMVSFLSPDDPQQWADCFDMILRKKFVFAGNKFATPREPFKEDWHLLSSFILNL